MKHSDKDIRAAKEYIKSWDEGYQGVAGVCFLAGLEHKQKDVDELVEALEESAMIIKAFNFRHTQIEKNNELIQKHKR